MIPTRTATLPDTSSTELPTDHRSEFQEGNSLPVKTFEPKKSIALENNHLGDMVSLYPSALPDHPNFEPPAGFAERINEKGLKWMRLSVDWYDWNEIEETGAYSQFNIDPLQIKNMDGLLSKNIQILYTLVFWDEEIQTTAGYTRFTTEEEVLRYLDYVRFLVRGLQGRVDYYSILNEPNIGRGTQQYVEAADYINLVKRTVPVIRQEDPDAKILIGEVTPLIWPHSIDYLFEILESDVLPLVDGLNWHAAGWASPEYMAGEYYQYQALVPQIMEMAAENGFTGEFWATEMHWRTSESPHQEEYDGYEAEAAAKYLARGIVMHRGWGIKVGLAENLEDPYKMPVIQNLCTILAGVEPTELLVEIDSQAENVMVSDFMNSQDELLVAIWSDGVAAAGSPGEPATVTIRGLSASEVVGVDVLNSIEQELVFSTDEGNTSIQRLYIKDYPIIVRIKKDSP